MIDTRKKIHFIGIGGIGMSAIANVLHKLGFNISGSDLKENIITRTLEKEGIKISYFHSGQNIENVDLVVYSSAIKKK